MKRLEQMLVRGRAAARAARSALPAGQARALRPSRLVLRLNDIHLAPGLVRAVGEPMDLALWQESIARVVAWLGPVRVTISGGEPARSGRLPDLVRFANRLECPTHLVTGGGLPTGLATELVDRGLAAVTVLVGGVDDATHRAAVGSSLDEATAAVQDLARARVDRGRRLGLYVGVPLLPVTLRSLGAVAGWARQAGADGVLATLPLGVDAPAGAAAAVAELGRDDLTPDHLRAWLSGEASRARGGLRLELLSDGTLLVSSVVGPLGDVRQAAPQQLWERSTEQVLAALRHPRPWDEVELVPRALYSTR